MCQYFTVGQGDEVSEDVAWSYPEPYESAIHKVKADFSNYVAFWRDVSVMESDPELDAKHEPALV